MLITEFKISPTVLYPASGALPYGENCYGLAAVFLIFKLIVNNDVWAYYFFISTIFALNGYAVKKFTNLFCMRELPSYMAGLAFCCAGFVLGNIDDPNVVFIFFPVMGLKHLFNWLKSGNEKKLYLGFFCFGCQIWFGLYVFTYQFLLIILFLICNRKQIVQRIKLKSLLVSVFLALIMTSPLLIVYIFNHNLEDITSIYAVFRDCSLELKNFFQRLPNNIIYKDAFIKKLDWVEIRKHCFTGIFLPLVALIGSVRIIKTSRSQGIFLILSASIFLSLSFGANNPMLSGYMELPFISYLRVPSRYYLITILILTVLYGIGVEVIGGLVRDEKKSSVIMLALGIAFVLENLPTQLYGHEYASILKPDPSYIEYFGGKKRRSIILDLPSTVLFQQEQQVNTADRIWFFSREAFYMNWQTYHHQIIVGGTNGYIPKRRLEIEEYIRLLPSAAGVKKLRNFGVEFIVYHKDMVLFPNENILDELKVSPYLNLRSENMRDVIFELSK